jgi:hypothetical protein
MTNIVTLDIETAPLKVYAWGIWEQNIGLDMIDVEWSILSCAAKNLGNKKVWYQDTSGQKNLQDDRKLLRSIWNILDEADIIVAQNGRRFDLKKINARMLMAGMKPYSPVRVIDTLEVAKQRFAFTSNKLEWQSKYLTNHPKEKHRIYPGFELWSECLKGNKRAWAELKKYNIRDVVATEELYLTQRPWITNHPNLGVYSEDAHTCPKCESSNVQKRGETVTQASRYQRYQCMDCGGWSRGKILLSTLKDRRSTLVSV